MSVVKAGVLEGSSDSEEEVHVYKLKIHDTEVKDAGEWRVEVADKYGSTSTSCNLAIRDDPKPKPSVTYAGKVGDKGDNSDDEEVHLYKLRIHDAKAEDAGRWRCEVEDKYGSASSSCNLMLDPYNRPSRPKFVTYLKDQKVEEGFSVRFQCVVTGNPVPRIEWYKDMEPVSKSSFMYTSYRGDGTASLQLFSPVADRDNGTYRCVARNSEGSSYSEAILTIHKQITNADLRDQFSISRARTRNEDLANFTGHHISKFQAAERMMLKSDQYTFETSPHLKKSELYHLDTQFKGHRKSDLYSSTGGRRAKKYESPDWEEETFDKRSSYNIENDYSPRKRYEDEYKIDLKGKSDVYNFENDYKIKSKSDPYKTDYMYGGKRDILDEMDYQRKLESKKSYDSLTSKRSFDKGFDKSSSNDIGFKYIPRRRELSKEINPGLSTRAKELSRGRSAGSAFDIGRSKSVSLGRDVSSRLILDDKKGYYTLRPRPKSVSLSRDSPMYDNRAKSMSVARDFGIKSGYESDKEDVYGAPRSRPKSASFSRELDSSRRTRSASLAREFAVKPETKFEDEHIYSKRDDRARSMSLSRDTEELIRNLRESSVGRSEFADIEAYRAELHKKQTKDKSKRSTTCKKKQRGKELKYQTFSKHFEDENKPIKEINPGLSMKAREIVNRQGYRYKVDRDLLNISMSRNRNKSHQTEDSGENELIVNGYRKPAETREPKSDEEEELSNEAFKRKTYLQNLDRFINRANQSFYDIEDSEVPSWRKEKLQDTGYDYTSHMARKNKIELFDFDDIRTSKVALRRDQQPRRAQSVGPELEPPKSKSANTRYNKERQALLNLGTNWVKDKPLAFIERLKSKSVLEGNTVLLSCFVTGKEPFVVLWYRRGIPLSRDEEETFHIRSNGGFLSLEVPIASTYDTGEYVVEVRNEEGKIKSSCYLQVEPIFDPRVEYKQPEFIEQIHHVHAKVGQAATFTCRVKGTPNPFVRWFKDGIELQQTDRINIHQGEKGQAFLLIHDTVEQDTGLYKCLAQSMAGRCQSTAKLQILESMADAFDDVSCNMEVERIISQTKFAKGDVGEASIQKPKAWRASLETTPATATVDQLTTQKETLEAKKQSDVKESPLKASEILTVLDETLKAAPLEMTSDPSTSPAPLTGSDKETSFTSSATDTPARVHSVPLALGSENETVLVISANQSQNNTEKVADLTAPQLDNIQSMNQETGQGTVLSSSDLDIAYKNSKAADQWQNNTDKVADVTTTQLNNAQSIGKEGQGTVLSISNQDIANQNSKVEQSQSNTENVANLTIPQLENIPSMSQEGQGTVLSSSDQDIANVTKNNQEVQGDSIELLSFNSDKTTTVSSEVRESPKEIVSETNAQFGLAIDSNLPSTRTVFKSDIDDINVVYDKVINSAPSSDAKNVRAIVSADDIKGDMRQEVTSPLQITSGRNGDKLDALPSKDNLAGIKETEQKLDSRVSNSIDLVDHKNLSELSGDNVDAQIDIEVSKETQRADSNAIELADIADKIASDFHENIPESSEQLNQAALPPVPCNLETVDILSTAHDTLVDKECVLSLTQTNDTNVLSELTTAPKVKQEKSTDNKSEMVTSKTIKEQNAELVSNPIQSESVALHDIDGVDSLSVTAQRVSSPIEKKVKPTEPDAAETSKIQKISLETKPESTKPAEDVPRTDVIDGKNVAAVGDEVTEIEVKETTTEKSGQIQAEKTDVKEVGEGKETVKQQKETPIEEASVETEKKKDVTETPVQAEKKEDVTDGSVQAEKKEDVKEASPGTVAALAEKEDSVPKEEEREPQPPTFVKKLPEKMDLKDGEDLLLQCITDGLPKPDVLWLHEKKVVEASQNVIIKDSHDVHSLEIKKVSHQVHSGSYIAKLIGGSGTSEEEEVVSSCKVFILSTAPAEQKAVMTEENIQDKDIIPVVERQISTDQEELKLKIPASVDLQEVCEEGQLDPDKMHIPVVSPTGVHCHSSPLDKASKEEELPPSQTSPHFTQPLDEELYPLERDENVRIQCVVAGEPCPKIVWFKDGEKLEPSSRIRLEWDPDTRIASVLLKRLHILDTGEYECIVYGENGSYSTKTTLHVKALEMQKVETIDRDDPPESVSPKFFLSLKDKKVYEGKGTTLDCVIKGVPQPTVKWLRHGKEIFPRSGKYLLTAINQQYSLTIEDFKKSDEGCYTVEAMNDSGSCSSSAYLTMEAVVAEVEKAAPENSPPEFTSKMEGLMVPVGGVVTFKCSASGYPVPKFKWQKDLLDVYQSKRITIDNTPGETTLTISDVTRRDGGMYVCVAKNTLGRNKQTVKLIVSDDCRETRRLSISGEIDRPDEQIISQSDSSNKMNDDVATETNLNVIEEQQLIQEKKDTGSEKVEQTTVNQQPEEAKTPEKEESVVAEDATQPENQPLSKDISQTNEAMTEESGKTPTVSSNDKQKEIEEVAEKDVQKNSDTLDAKTEVGQKVEVQEIQPTVQEEQPLKEEKGDESKISEGKAAAVEEEPVQVSEDKIVSSLKTVGSEAEVSLMENIDFVSVENASFIQKEQTLADESTVENVEVQKVETDGQISKSEKKNAEEMMTSPKIDDQEKVKQLSEKVSSNEEKGVDSKTSESGESLKIKNDKIADTEKCSDIKTSASSASSISEEVTVKKSVQTAESTATIKTVTEDVELDIDHLVEQAETILGESVSSKSEVQDVSFEEVLAKSVLEESVAEAAGEMEKSNKTKKRRLSKTKRRSMSLESEEVTGEKDAAERTSTPIKELETGSATGVTGSTTKKEVSTSQRSTKTKSVSFEEIVETSGSSDAVDSSKTSSKTSSKATVSESFTESSASVVEIKSAKEMSVSEKETTSESTAAVKTEKREIRALDRMMSMEDVKDILDVDTLKMNETREAIVEQKTASGKTQVLEVSARRVSKQLSVEEQAKVATHRHHLHHPPEIIVPPENQFVSLHSEIELTVKVRAAHGAKISWYHDGHQVAVTEKALKEIYGEHYELMDEEVAEDK